MLQNMIKAMCEYTNKICTKPIHQKRIRQAVRLAQSIDHTNTRRRRVRLPNTLLACAALAMQAGTSLTAQKYENTAVFDTDSRAVGIDNRCLGCMSEDINDFEGALRDSNRVIKGFGGTRTTGVKVGTIKWQWYDDEGKIHTFQIPNSYYVLDAGVKLLSPQHWAKAMKDNKPIEGREHRQ
mmetsp:Transcript_23790/g.36117  ORF Transcript_23790/g.36117 Transcript_23790/m.36117 type:complete len:181 (+) Transcript_23790:127-669(+)